MPDDDEDVVDLEVDEIYTQDVDSLDESADRRGRRDRDGVESMQDVEAEQGDEQEVDDDFEIDRREARQAGVNLDSIEDEARLD